MSTQFQMAKKISQLSKVVARLYLANDDFEHTKRDNDKLYEQEAIYFVIDARNKIEYMHKQLTERKHALNYASEKFRIYRKEEEKEQFLTQSKINECKTATKLAEITMKSRYAAQIEKVKKDYKIDEEMVRNKIDEVKDRDRKVYTCIQAKELKFLREIRAWQDQTSKEKKVLSERHQLEIVSLVNIHKEDVISIKMDYIHENEKCFLNAGLKKEDLMQEVKNHHKLSQKIVRNYISKKKEQLGLNVVALKLMKENVANLRTDIEYMILVGKNLGIQNMKEKAIITNLEQKILNVSRHSEMIQELRSKLASREDVFCTIMKCNLSLSHSNMASTVTILQGKEGELRWYANELNVVNKKYENVLLEKRILEVKENANMGILKEIDLNAKKTTNKCATLLISTKALRSDQEKLKALTRSTVANISIELKNIREQFLKAITLLEAKADKIQHNIMAKELTLITRWKEDLNRVLHTVEELRTNQASTFKQQYFCVKYELKEKIQHLTQRVKEYMLSTSITLTMLHVKQKEYVENERKKWEQEAKERKKEHEDQLLLCCKTIERVKASMGGTNKGQFAALQERFQEKESLFRDEMAVIKKSQEKNICKVKEHLKREVSRAKDKAKKSLATQSLARKEEIDLVSKRHNENNRRRWDKLRTELKLKIRQEIRQEKKRWLELKSTLENQINASITTVDQVKERLTERLLMMQQAFIEKRTMQRKKSLAIREKQLSETASKYNYLLKKAQEKYNRDKAIWKQVLLNLDKKQTDCILHLKSKHEANMCREKRRWNTRENELMVQIRNSESCRDVSISKLEDLEKASINIKTNKSKLEERLIQTELKEKTTMTSLEELKVKYNMKQEEVEELQKKLEGVRQICADLIKQNERDCNNLIRHIKSKLAMEHENSQAEKQHRRIKELNMKLLNTSNELKQRIADYDTRESRPEDVARIHELMQQLSQSIDSEEKRKEEMLLYKRELLNREENFNAIFASTVGGVSSKFKDHPTYQNGSKCAGALMNPVRGHTKGKFSGKGNKIVNSSLLGSKGKSNR